MSVGFVLCRFQFLFYVMISDWCANVCFRYWHPSQKKKNSSGLVNIYGFSCNLSWIRSMFRINKVQPFQLKFNLISQFNGETNDHIWTIVTAFVSLSCFILNGYHQHMQPHFTSGEFKYNNNNKKNGTKTRALFGKYLYASMPFHFIVTKLSYLFAYTSLHFPYFFRVAGNGTHAKTKIYCLHR